MTIYKILELFEAIKAFFQSGNIVLIGTAITATISGIVIIFNFLRKIFK